MSRRRGPGPDDIFRSPHDWAEIPLQRALREWRSKPVVTLVGGSVVAGRAQWFSPRSQGHHRGPLGHGQRERYFLYRGDGARDLSGLGGSPGTNPTPGPPPDKPPVTPPTPAETWWINVRVVDEFGAPLAGVAVHFEFSDASKRSSTSDAAGGAWQDAVPAGNCKVTLRRNLFFSHTAGALSPSPTADGALAAGEYFGAKARAAGLEDARTLYHHPENGALRASRAALGLVTAGDTFKVPSAYTVEFPTFASGAHHQHVLTVPALLDIVRADGHFAPGAESLDVTYELAGLAAQTVKVTVTSDQYPNNPILERELTDAEKSDGLHTLSWDGKTTCASGELAGRYINPLFAPYKVVVSAGAKHTDTREFKVFYHSIALRRGPWTPDEAAPAESEEQAWAQYRLNELGYFGGPVRKDTESYLKKAVIRYKANHRDLHEIDQSRYDDTLTATLKDALRRGDNPRVYLRGDGLTNPKKTANLRVEAITYQETGTATPYAEWQANQPARCESDRLNRPLLPLEVDILLVPKASTPGGVGAGVLAPRGVGPVRINWRFSDSQEDLTSQYVNSAAEPSETKAFLTKALALQSGGASGDNAHKNYAGIRDDAATTHAPPFFLGDAYVPYTVQDDAGLKVVWSTACADESTYPKRLGRAGVMFRPSYVAGDDYTITAELDFTGRGNKAALEAAHQYPAKTLRARSGKLTVKRYNRVAALVNWPARTGSLQWAEIAAEFSKAHLEMDVGGIQTFKISEVITDAEYKAIVAANTAFTAAQVTLSDDHIFGRALPGQGAQTDAVYRTALATLTDTNFWAKVHHPLRRLITQKIRQNTAADGFIVTNVVLHKPATVASPTVAAAVSIDTDHVTSISSVGEPDSFMLINLRDTDKTYYVVSHEMGHGFWLQHWEHADGSTPDDHDTADHNCTMSYTSGSCAHAHHRVGVYTPHFCGKCNLRLRGWDLTGTGMLASST